MIGSAYDVGDKVRIKHTGDVGEIIDVSGDEYIVLLPGQESYDAEPYDSWDLEPVNESGYGAALIASMRQAIALKRRGTI
jgi:hypothetical protein